jgi:uncharacterized protein
MLDCIKILEIYYSRGSELYNLLIAHSQQVANFALEIAHRNPQLNIDCDFVYEAAMLHDIGVFKTHAPSIHCVGDMPYICHGIIGREILEAEGLPRHALVCEHHTGSGLTIDEIIAQELPLPHRDMRPTTIEEKLVCYADKFFSKSRIAPAKPLEKVQADMARFGEASLNRFNELTALFNGQ